MSGMWRDGTTRELLPVCLDLQQASLAHGRGLMGDDCVINCGRVLRHARVCGWQVVHVHARQADSEATRPIAGLEPLTTEPLVYRSGVSAFSSRVFRQMVTRLNCELV